MYVLGTTPNNRIFIHYFNLKKLLGHGRVDGIITLKKKKILKHILVVSYYIYMYTQNYEFFTTPKRVNVIYVRTEVIIN